MTPRTGSSFLSEALKATGVAGVPEEYFNAENIEALLAEYSCDTLTELHTTILGRGTTSNGIFGTQLSTGAADGCIRRPGGRFRKHDAKGTGLPGPCRYTRSHRRNCRQKTSGCPIRGMGTTLPRRKTKRLAPHRLERRVHFVINHEHRTHTSTDSKRHHRVGQVDHRYGDT